MVLCRGRFFLRLLFGLLVFLFRLAWFLFGRVIDFLIDKQRSVDPFQISNRSGIALALPKSYDSCVTAVAIGATWCDFVEQFLHRAFLPQHRESGPASMDRSFLA